jgi:hypothetical protein
MAEVGPITVEFETELGGRVRLINRMAVLIGWLPDALLERIINWAVKGVKVSGFVR